MDLQPSERRQLNVGVNANDEQSRPRLRHEQRGVHHDGADGVASLLKPVADRREILAVMRIQMCRRHFQAR